MKLSILLETADDVIYEEPMGEFEYLGEKYPYWGNPRGRNRTVDYNQGKFNRYAKLGLIADEKIREFISLIKSDPDGLAGRCAYACTLMMRYGVRIGNEGSAEGYVSGLEKNKGEVVNTYGTTTLLNEHVSFSDGKMYLNFLGKEQVSHSIEIREPVLVSYGKKYWSENPKDRWLKINYDILFKFVKQSLGDGFVPKDLRTFCGNTNGWKQIKKFLDKSQHTKKSDAKKDIKMVVERVAGILGNTPGVSKANYLDARMLDWFLNQRWAGNPYE